MYRTLPYARVAIITRTKDRPILLRRAIRSALNQTFRDWLLVIVNDGGEPETIKLVVDEFDDAAYPARWIGGAGCGLGRLGRAG